jgi:hypothetical protein
MELYQLDVHIDGFTKLRLSLFEGAELCNLPRLAACAARWTVEMAHCRIIHNRPRLEEIQDGKGSLRISAGIELRSAGSVLHL